MRRTVISPGSALRPFFLSIWLVAVSTQLAASSGVPIAEWYAVPPALDQKSRDLILRMREARLPTIDEVGVEAYPGAKLFMVLPTREPERIESDTGEPAMKSSILLLSRDSVDRISAWYKERLPGYSPFSTEEGVLLVKDAPQGFNYDTDPGLLQTHAHVYVKHNTNTTFRALTPGYSSLIEIGYFR